MPNIEANLKVWNQDYDWSRNGDEWSEPWGNARHQWMTFLLPRIYHFLPAAHVLEIAPGHGRWTQFLIEQCEYISLVDLSANCIDFCRAQFAALDKVDYFVNDGKTLSGVKDASIDFVFSFDSLVHAENEALNGYIPEVYRVLREGGVAFIHHSNLGAYNDSKLSRIKSKILRRLHLKDFRTFQRNTHWRGKSVSSAGVRELAMHAGFGHISQEIFQWHGMKWKIDCISVLRKTKDSPPKAFLFENGTFHEDVRNSVALLKCYGT